MVRVLLLTNEEKLVEKALADHDVSEIHLAMDETVPNRHMIKRLGLHRYALVGANADKDLFDVVLPTTPAKKGKKSKKALAEIGAVVDESTKESEKVL